MTLTHKMLALVGVAATSLILNAQTSSLPTTNNTHGENGDLSSSGGFCKGMFMVMSMSGFQWSLAGREPGDCLSYFAPAWKLDERGKFQGAMVYTFLLAILAEGSYALQVWIRPYLSKSNNQRLQQLTNSILYGMQRFMVYIIMLIAMMFSWELLISVILGVVVGRLMFPNGTRREWQREARRAQSITLPSSSHPTLAATLDESLHNGEEEPLLTGDALMRRRR